MRCSFYADVGHFVETNQINGLKCDRIMNSHRINVYPKSSWHQLQSVIDMNIKKQTAKKK